MTMGFDPQSGELRWKSGDYRSRRARAFRGLDEDFWGRTRDGATTMPGPFGNSQGRSGTLIVDPKSQKVGGVPGL